MKLIIHQGGLVTPEPIFTWSQVQAREGVYMEYNGGTATGLWMGTMYYSTGKKYARQTPVPIVVRRFINAMDRGELPQFEL